jgi:hypothetical protein
LSADRFLNSLGFRKDKAKDIHPYDAFVADLARVVSAAKARGVGLRAISDTLLEHGQSLTIQAAVCWQPTRIYSGNLPE